MGYKLKKKKRWKFDGNNILVLSLSEGKLFSQHYPALIHITTTKKVNIFMISSLSLIFRSDRLVIIIQNKVISIQNGIEVGKKKWWKFDEKNILFLHCQKESFLFTALSYIDPYHDYFLETCHDPLGGYYFCFIMPFLTDFFYFNLFSRAYIIKNRYLCYLKVLNFLSEVSMAKIGLISNSS